MSGGLKIFLACILILGSAAAVFVINRVPPKNGQANIVSQMNENQPIVKMEPAPSDATSEGTRGGLDGKESAPPMLLNHRDFSVTIDSIEIPVEIASTSFSRMRGLSGKKSLDANSGMLFVFSQPSRYAFWMPNMNFPIDIIWINKNKVVDISANVSNVFSLNNPVFYRPEEPAQYVLEVNAGFSENKNIKIGDTVLFVGINKE